MRLYTLAMTVVVFASENGEDFFEALFQREFDEKL